MNYFSLADHSSFQPMVMTPSGQVYSGVPQESGLVALFIFIYINDLPALVTSNVRLFGDDGVIFYGVLTEYDTNIFQ